MNPRSPTSSAVGGGYPSKRPRHSPPDSKSPLQDLKDAPLPGPSPPAADAPAASTPVAAPTAGGQSSSFRNVSACNRCRLRKNRCDQRLPSCASCEKASVKCVGYDPITKREIPRSYVYYLETRVGYLEDLLKTNNISFAPPEVLDTGAKPNAEAVPTPTEEVPPQNGDVQQSGALVRAQSQKEEAWRKNKDESERVNKMVSNIGMVSVQGASDPRYLGSTSGISFARVVFAAVKSSVSGSNSEKGGIRPSGPIAANKAAAGATGGGTSMRDSFFGLHTKPTIKQAPFPDKEVATKLVDLYFEHANPQVPILHRGEFMKMFNNAYGSEKERVRGPRELYMLNIVFAIGAGIVLGDSTSSETEEQKKGSPNAKRTKHANQQCQPEEYHASAIVHLEACLANPGAADRPDGFGGGLEELQAVLLLAGFALLRPVAPGLWYIIGVAVRLAVDLGLHYEDGKDIDTGLDEALNTEIKIEGDSKKEHSSRERGRREWIRDFRRRLWWCVYSLDRLVSTCVGRPFGITDQVVTTEFPSLLEDEYITPTGFLAPSPHPDNPPKPTYKLVAHHYFRLRLLQSEILQVLQHQQASAARAGGTNSHNPFMHTQLPSPFLSKFDSFRSWRIDIDRRLWQWKESAPTKAQTGVAFSIEFLELNYWQAVIMLYRQSLSVPTAFQNEYDMEGEIGAASPGMGGYGELREDEERVFLKVAEAGQRVLRLYRMLHRVCLVNYTFLATHHLFMAGISFLYAIWHSPIVRSRLTMDEVDFTILAATSVLGDLIDKCPPAEACRDAFERMSKATVQMCMSTTGFSSSTVSSGLNSRSHHRPGARRTNSHTEVDYFGGSQQPSTQQRQFPPSVSVGRSQQQQQQQQPQQQQQQQQQPRPARQKPQFDMGLNDLFPQSNNQAQSPLQHSQQAYPQQQRREGNGYADPQTPYQQMAPHHYSLSPTADPHAAIDPSLLPSPSQSHGRLQGQQTQTTPGSQQQAYPQSQQGHTPTSNPDLYPQQQQQMSELADFQIEGFGGGIAGQEWGGRMGTGVDLGFGLGWDGMDHDFSEGNQVDLFDGFFFGGGSGGGGFQ